MYAGGLILGLALIALATWLHWRERRGWIRSSSGGSQLDRDYFGGRLRRRRRIHVLLLICGVLILLATLVGPEVRWAWLLGWILVSALLLIVMVLAAFDAMGTQRYHAEKLPEIRRRLFGDD